tara:strand:- start:1329 stop:1514 length:186 start_codon:yes stop_codon:yes gene_type:complete
VEDISQWLIALLIGLPIAALLAWFNKSGYVLKMDLSRKQRKVIELPIINRIIFLRIRDDKR